MAGVALTGRPAARGRARPCWASPRWRRCCTPGTSPRPGYAPFYSVAVKSMSESWKAFFYGAFDPRATITIDKLAGSFLPQALSARIFGFHAVVARAAAGHRGRHLGSGHVPGGAPLGGRAARAAGGRDLRADADRGVDVRAQHGGRRADDVPGPGRRRLPARGHRGAAAVARLVRGVGGARLPGQDAAGVDGAARAGHRLPARRARAGCAGGLWQLGVAGVVMLAVSLSWIALYTFTPARDRPYVDGSTNNSAVAMVFGYNGLERFGITVSGAVTSGPGVTSAGGATGRGGASRTAAPAAVRPRQGSAAAPPGTATARRRSGRHGAGRRRGIRAASRNAFGQGWTKLLGSSYGPEIGWLYPLAVLALDLRPAVDAPGQAHRPGARRVRDVGRLAAHVRPHLQHDEHHPAHRLHGLAGPAARRAVRRRDRHVLAVLPRRRPARPGCCRSP